MYISKENFMEANLSGICRINVIDYSDYIAEKSHDGGHYAFYTTFVKEEYDDKSWYIMYSSSSDFACCHVCGQFADHNDPNEDTCYDSGYTCGEFEILSTDEMKERIEQMDDIEIQILRRRIKLSGNENMGVMFESDAPDAVIDEAVENSRTCVDFTSVCADILYRIAKAGYKADVLSDNDGSIPVPYWGREINLEKCGFIFSTNKGTELEA